MKDLLRKAVSLQYRKTKTGQKKEHFKKNVSLEAKSKDMSVCVFVCVCVTNCEAVKKEDLLISCVCVGC